MNAKAAATVRPEIQPVVTAPAKRVVHRSNLTEQLRKIEMKAEMLRKRLEEKQNSTIDPGTLDPVSFNVIREQIYKYRNAHNVPIRRIVEAIVRAEEDNDSIEVRIVSKRGPMLRDADGKVIRGKNKSGSAESKKGNGAVKK